MSASTSIHELLIAIRALPVRDRLNLVEHVVHEIASDNAAVHDQNPNSVIGYFEDIADVMEDVAAAAMVARERDPLRLSNGLVTSRHGHTF